MSGNLGGRRLMAKTILNFHFDYLTTPLGFHANPGVPAIPLWFPRDCNRNQSGFASVQARDWFPG